MNCSPLITSVKARSTWKSTTCAQRPPDKLQGPQSFSNFAQTRRTSGSLWAVDCGMVRLATGDQPDLCLVADHNDSIPTGGPSHLRRDFTLEGCESISVELSSWTFGIFDY